MANYPDWKITLKNVQGEMFGSLCRITVSLHVRVVVMTCATQLHSLQTDTVRQTHRQTERQLLAGYANISAKGTNRNSEHVMLMTSFIICMTWCYIKVSLTSFTSFCNLT